MIIGSVQLNSSIIRRLFCLHTSIEKHICLIVYTCIWETVRSSYFKIIYSIIIFIRALKCTNTLNIFSVQVKVIYQNNRISTYTLVCTKYKEILSDYLNISRVYKLALTKVYRIRRTNWKYLEISSTRFEFTSSYNELIRSCKALTISDWFGIRMWALNVGNIQLIINQVQTCNSCNDCTVLGGGVFVFFIEPSRRSINHRVNIIDFGSLKLYIWLVGRDLIDDLNYIWTNTALHLVLSNSSSEEILS